MMPTQPPHSDANSPPHCREINNKYIVSPPLASFISPDMDDPSSSLLDFDFGAGFDVSEDDAFDDFDADFGRAFDFGDALDAASCNFDGSVTAKVDDASFGNISEDSGCPRPHRRKICRTNRVYRVESVTESAWYRYFTRPGMTRDLTHELLSSDCFGHFRHYFCMPLSKVEELTDMLIKQGYVFFPRTRWCQAKFWEQTELLVMSSLSLLANGAAIRAIQPLCSISTFEVHKFYYLFLDAIVDMRNQQIYMPRNRTDLTKIEGSYSAVGLPGCCVSVDVVHVKWSNCPSGDFYRAKGKEAFPSLRFECITDFNCRILSVYGPHFGSRNNMDIVKTDLNVHTMMKNCLHRDAMWRYYGHDGHVRTNRGLYLICDNGYLR